MLLTNIYVQQGLVSGAICVVEDIDFPEDYNEMPLRICVKFNDSHFEELLKNSNHKNAIPIEPITQEFYSHGRIIVRLNFPLVPCWACTIHKMQGLSLQHCVTNIGSDVFEKGQV